MLVDRDRVCAVELLKHEWVKLGAHPLVTDVVAATHPVDRRSGCSGFTVFTKFWWREVGHCPGGGTPTPTGVDGLHTAARLPKRHITRDSMQARPGPGFAWTQKSRPFGAGLGRSWSGRAGTVMHGVGGLEVAQHCSTAFLCYCWIDASEILNAIRHFGID